MISSRDNFSQAIIETIKKRAAYICSNPNCRKMTIAPSLDAEDKVQYIGNVSHISAASPGGPRYLAKLISEKRQSISNAIFLCSNCANMIDKNDGKDYDIKLLNNWKKEHEEWVIANLNKSLESIEHSNFVHTNNQSGGIAANNLFVQTLNFQNESDEQNHDRRIFNYNNQFFNESELDTIIETFEHTNLIPANELKGLLFFQKNMDKLDNEYLNPELERLKLGLVSNINDLLAFINKFYEFDVRSKKLTKNRETYTSLILKGQFSDFGSKLKKRISKNHKIITQTKSKLDILKTNYEVYRRKIKQTLST